MNEYYHTDTSLFLRSPPPIIHTQICYNYTIEHNGGHGNENKSQGT